MRIILALFIAFVVFGCKSDKMESQIKEDSKLIAQFQYNGAAKPMISAHRGGKGIPGYPENCIETMKFLNDSISAVFEIDVAKTKDGVLVLMHDKTIDRTTTGFGLISEVTYSELRALKLKDDSGKITQYEVPTFQSVLNWAVKENAILTLDIKKSVSLVEVLDYVAKIGAEDVSAIITYDLQQAKEAYKLAPHLLLSVSARNDKEFQGLLDSEIPTSHMLAFTGTKLSKPELFEKIHSNGIYCMLGTIGNLDGMAEARGDELYRTWIALGADILATDRPIEAANSIAD